MGLLDAIFGDPSKDLERAEARARREEQERRELESRYINQIRTDFGRQFTPGYYDNLGDAIRNLLQPQLQQGYERAYEGTIFGLARNNMLGSTVRNTMEDRLRRDYAQGGRQIESQAQGTVAQRKTDVANAMDALIAQIRSGVDPASVAGQAAARIEANTYEPQYQPLGQVFVDATNLLATQADLERRQIARYPTGWFGGGSSGGSSTVVGGRGG